jgi:glycosyltransferase involved in cell wall biosynthesis
VLTQDRGGPVDATVALAARLDAVPGYQVRLFAPQPSRGLEAVAHLLEESRVGGKGAARAIVTARRRILAWKPDVIHAQDRRAGLVCAYLGTRRTASGTRRSVVHTYHGVPDDVTQAWLDDPSASPPPSRYTRTVLAADAVVARAVDRTIVVAPILRTFLIERLRVPAERVVHIDNGLALPPASPPSGPIRRLLFVGMLIERKGVDVLLSALAHAVEDGVPHDVHLTVVGDGPERAALESSARSLGLAERVDFLGFRTDVPQLMATADAFVLPARMEQQPLVLIEAMASGLLVLATDVGGVRDMLGGLGMLVPADDPLALARGIATLVTSDGAARAAALASHAHQRFGVDASLGHHLDLYAHLQRWSTVRPEGNG